MNAKLLLAKKHAARRRDQGGAAMFVVAMTVAVLASVGVYALAAAAMEVRTSGNERQSTQTHYLAEYGVLTASHEVAASKADFYLRLMQNQPDTCISLANVPSTAPAIIRACRRLGSDELSAGWRIKPVDAYTGNVPYANGVAPGSLGAMPIKGDFFVELTEATQARPATRYSGEFCFVQMTVTSVGLTRPLFPSLSNSDLSSYGSEGVETQRARISAGPVPCPKWK